MSANRLLAFSSSRVGKGGYLETALPIVKEFLGDKVLNIAFIPFAAVGNDFDDYTSMVKKGLEGLPHTIDTVTPGRANEVIEKADVIMVGGGNTFKLLHDIYYLKLLDIIRDKVNNGAPYIGWSAGSNILGPTIGTTNDMPVIEPKSFNALGLLPFQINPHYTNVKPDGHNGETRDQRLEEFIMLNPGLPIVGLPEGTALKLNNGLLSLLGIIPAVLFQTGTNEQPMIRREIAITEDISFLL
jgi:dipeptidase E